MSDFIIPKTNQNDYWTKKQQEFQTTLPQQNTQENYWDQRTQTVVQQKEERLANYNRYGVDVPDEYYEQFNKIISQTEGPEQAQEEAYRIGSAVKYSQMYGIPLEEAYSKVDEFNTAQFTDLQDQKKWYEAVSDMFNLGTNNVKLGQLGQKLMTANATNDTETIQSLMAEIDAIQQQNQLLQDNTPRGWVMEALEAGAQSLPFTGYVAGAGLFGNFIAPAVGTGAAFAASSYLVAGQEYIDMLANGASHETAAIVASVSGGIQGIIEANLGITEGIVKGTAKVMGKEAAEKAAKVSLEEITKKVAKRFHFGAGKKLLVNYLEQYGKNVLGEGVEEFLQEITSILGQEAAAAMDGYDIPDDDFQSLVNQTTEAFKGGILGALALGFIPAGIKTPIADVKEYRRIRTLAETVESDEMFEKAVEGSKIFEGMSDDYKKEVIHEIKDKARNRIEVEASQNAADIAEVQDAARGAEERQVTTDEEGNEIEAESEAVAREESGKLMYSDDENINDDGTVSGTFRAGDKTKEDNNRYGYIKYTADEDNKTVTIYDFKMAKGREGLRGEVYDEFAQKYAGYDIQWNAVGSEAIQFKENLIQNNPSGAVKGLNYYADQNAVADAGTRAKVAAEVKKNIHNVTRSVDENGNVTFTRTDLTNKQVASAVALLEAAAKRTGMNLTEYVNKTFGNNIFGSQEDFTNTAAAQGDTATGKAGGVNQGIAQKGWQQYGQQIKAVIYAGENADFSTWAHELAHVFQNQLDGDLKAQAESAFGVVNGDWIHSKYTFKDGHVDSAAEAFAYGFQDWLKTGQAESEEMKNIFQKFAEFIVRAFNSLKDFINLTPEIKDVYNQLLSGDDSLLKAAEQAVEAEDKRYRAQMQQNARNAEKERKAQAEQEKKQEEAEREEAEETTDFDNEIEADNNEIEELNNGVDNAKSTNAINNALENSNLTDKQKTQIADVLKDPDTTVVEKAEASTEAASSAYDDTQIPFDLFQTEQGQQLLYQLAGEKSIQRMAESEEKERILADLDAAKLLDGRYKSMDTEAKASRIRRMTGWEKDATGRWKYETDDSVNRIKTEVFKNNPELLTDQSTATLMNLSDILEAPELYKVFPYMKNVRVSFYSDPNAFRAVLTPQGIKVNTRYLQGMDGEKGLKGVLAHEIQHVIQAMEYAESTGLQGQNIEQLYNDMMDAMQAAGERKYDYDLTSLQNGLDAYMKDEGEIEARNVARRVLMNADQRRMNTLASTEDVKRNNILFQTVTVEDFKNRIESIVHTPTRQEYIDKFYNNIKDRYVNMEVTSQDGTRKGVLEISNDKNLKDKRTLKEIDAGLKFKEMGYEPTLLSEDPAISNGKKIDLLLNHNVLVEVKTPTGNAQSVASDIKDAINKKNSEIVSVFMIDNEDITDADIEFFLEKNKKNIHGDTDGIFIFRNDGLSEIKKPRADTETALTSGNSNIAQDESEVNKKRDEEYKQAVESGDTEKAMQMLQEEAERKGYTSNSDYQGTSAFNGAAPYRNGYFETKEARLQAIKDGEFEDTETLGDFAYDNADALGFDYLINDPRAYRAADEKRKEGIDNLRNAIKEAQSGKKNVTIKMYRSVPIDVKENSFRNGDWITPSKSYAEDNADVHSWGEGEYRIIEQDVDLEDIWWDGNEIAEWGYDDQKESVYKNTENNRKLYEITYDKDGNLIPLSKRFDENNPDILFQKVYHGTPYNFEQFSTENIGTGEGAQSFGWGLYFTNQEGIARFYADSLTNSSKRITLSAKKDFLKSRKASLKQVEDKEKYEARILKNINHFNKELKQARKENDESQIKFYEGLIDDSYKQLDEKERLSLVESFKKDIENTTQEIKELEKSMKNNRNLYTVEIPDDGYLLWDQEYKAKDLQNIKKALYDRILDEYFGGDKDSAQYEVDAIFTDEITGEEIYHSIQHELGSDKAASLFLAELGYVGIDYPAHTIAGNPVEGERNYVIFNDEDAKIVNHMFFQTEAELQDEAKTFDTWQEFMEYCEVMHSMDDVSPIPSDADALWYQSYWETSHGIQTEQEQNEQTVQDRIKAEGTVPGAVDAYFVSMLKSDPTMLDNFLQEVANIDAIDFDSEEWRNVADEQDAAERERIDQLKDFISITLSDYNWQTAIKRIQGGHEIAEGLRKRLLGEMTDSYKTRDFRSLYSSVMEDPQYAVEEEDSIASQLSKKLSKYQKRYYDILKPNEDIARVSPERRKRIAQAMQNADIAAKIRNGSLKLDDELDAYIKSLEAQEKELQKQYDELEKETQNDYQRLADAERRKLLKLHDELLVLRSKMSKRDAEVDRKINKGLKITEKYRRESQNMKANYDELFRKFSDLKSTIQITAEVQAALDRQEKLAGLKDDINNKQKEKNLTNEVKKMRIQLVKKAMRRVPFNRIDYENARTIIAIQRMLEPNLIGGVNRFIGIDSPFLRGVISQIVTDSEYKQKILNYLNKASKSSEAYVNFVKKIEGLKSIKDFDSWTAKERKYAIKHLPKENWVRDLNLMELAKEREESIDLDIDTKEKRTPKIDPKTGRVMTNKDGDVIYETTFVLDAADDLKKLVQDAVGADMFNMILNVPFSEWTTEDLERIAQRIDELYTEGRDMLAAKQEARRRENDAIRKRVEDAIKETGITINDDDTPEEKARKQEKINKILGLNKGLKGTEAGKNKGILAKFDRLIHGYSDANILRVGRILDNQSEGVNVQMLYRAEDECFNAKTRSIMARGETVKKVMADNKITEEGLAQTVRVAQLDTEFTVDELLYFLAADEDYEIDPSKAATALDPLEMNDDWAATSRNAVMFGNIMSDNMSQEQKEQWVAQDKAMQEAIENDALTPEQMQDLAIGMLDKHPGTTAYIRECHARWSAALGAANQFLAEHPEYKALMEAIQADYANQYERMNEISINEFNQPVHRVKAYVPLVRRESNGDTNINQVKEDLLGAYGADAGKQWVNRGMTQRRVNISPLNQKPVQTGLFRTWGDSIERTEHFIAYAPYVRQLNAIYKSRDANYTRRFIESRYGKGMLEYIDSYINEVANPNANKIREKGAEFLHTLRGKTAPAYLGWKFSAIVKQGLNTPWPYMQFVNPAEYMAACFKCVNGGYDAVKQKSAYMASRVMDPINELVDEMADQAKNKVDRAWSNFAKKGMAGLEWIDWTCVAPGWLACYQKEYNRLEAQSEAAYEAKKAELTEKNMMADISTGEWMSAEQIEAQARKELMDDIETAAVRYADDCTRQCQPSSRVTDLAPLFKNSSEAMKAFLQFQTSLNVIWQNIRYDIPYAVRQKQFKRIAGTVCGYVFAGIFMNSVMSGIKGDDDDDDMQALRNLIFYSTTQFTDAIPMIGSDITNSMDQIITGKRGFMNSGTDMTPSATKMMSALQKATQGDWKKAATLTAEGIGLFLGAPVSGIKEINKLLGKPLDEGDVDLLRGLGDVYGIAGDIIEE